MNMAMPASIIRMPFLSLSFYFLKKIKINLTRRQAIVSFVQFEDGLSVQIACVQPPPPLRKNRRAKVGRG